MNTIINDKIEAYLKKGGFFKLTGRDVWAAGKVPHQRIVDLSIEPPWIGISTGTQRQEAEECGIAQVQDIKQAVLNIYNADIKKPAEREKSLVSDTPSPKEESPMEPKSDTAAVRPASAGESHLFICSACRAGITAEQRSTSYKKHGRALCEKCITVPPPELGKEKPKEEPAPKPEPKTKKEEKPMPEKKDENLPAEQPKGEAPALSDHQIDEMIERAKARKFLEGQGGSYKVSGKERPDSAMIQKISNEAGISTEILVAEQTDNYAHIVVRGHLGNRFVDAVVHHDFAVEFQLKTMEILEKNPQILDHYEGLTPVIKEGAKIIKKTDRGEEQIDAKYYLVHALLSFKKFSCRDAATKASAIVQAKLLNRDARDPEEVKSEQADRDLVEKNKKKPTRKTDDRYNADYPGAKC